LKGEKENAKFKQRQNDSCSYYCSYDDFNCFDGKCGDQTSSGSAFSYAE